MQKKYTILRFLMLALAFPCSAKTNLSKKQKWGIGGGVTTLTTGGIGAAVYSSRNKMKKIDYSDSDSEANLLLFKPSENKIRVIARKKGYIFGKVSDRAPFFTRDIDYLKDKHLDGYEYADGVLRITEPMSDKDYREIQNTLYKRSEGRERYVKNKFVTYKDKDGNLRVLNYKDKDGNLRFLSKDDYIKNKFVTYKDKDGNLRVLSKDDYIRMRKLIKQQDEDQVNIQKMPMKSIVEGPDEKNDIEKQPSSSTVTTNPEDTGGKAANSVNSQVSSDTSAITGGVNSSESTVQSGSNQPNQTKQTGSDGQSQVEPGENSGPTGKGEGEDDVVFAAE